MTLIKIGMNHYVPLRILVKRIPKQLARAFFIILTVFILGVSSGAGWC